MEKKKIAVLLILILAFIAVVSEIYVLNSQISQQTGYTTRNVISITKLPSPQLTGNMSVEQAIEDRRSVREYNDEPINISDVSQLLWAGQGITDPQYGLRAAPSAGQVYPLELYVIVGTGGVTGLPAGEYLYVPENNTLEKLINGDLRAQLATIADGQPWVQQGQVDIVITGNYQKMIDKYPDVPLSTRFVNLEAGHVGETIYLQAEPLGLATVSIGSFNENQMISLMHLQVNEEPIYIFPIGHPK